MWAGSAARVRGLREILVLLAALALCPIAALAIGTDAAAPLARGAAVVDLERALGIFVEPAVHGWTAERPSLLALAGVFYVWAHVPVAGWALVWTWYLRPDMYVRVCTTFLLTQVLTVCVYVAYPTAPPRLLGGEGFTDTLSGLWGKELADSAHLLQSPYAAMPSGHVAFALVAGGTFALLGDRRWLRLFGWAYPPLVALVTIATANHYVVDVLAATAVVAVAVKLVCSTPWPMWKRTSPAPSGRSSATWETPSRRATRSSSWSP